MNNNMNEELKAKFTSYICCGRFYDALEDHEYINSYYLEHKEIIDRLFENF